MLEQGKHQTIANTQMIERFQQAKTFLDMNGPELKSVQRDALNQAWAGLKPDKAANAIRDARLALVVAIFEGANFAKCAYQLLSGSKRDARTGFAMLASSLAITSLMLDITATAAKNVFNQTADDALKGMGDAAKAAAKDFGERSWSYQKLKLYGGVLSAGASFIGAVIDYQDATDALAKSKYKLSLLYFSKSISGGMNVIIGLATAITYAPKLTAQIIGRTLGTNAARVITNRAIAIAAFRLIGMGLGGWLTVASLAITAIIYWFSDNELQKWCDRCAFGQRRSVEPYNNLKQQQEELEKALIETV